MGLGLCSDKGARQHVFLGDDLNVKDEDPQEKETIFDEKRESSKEHISEEPLVPAYSTQALRLTTSRSVVSFNYAAHEEVLDTEQKVLPTSVTMGPKSTSRKSVCSPECLLKLNQGAADHGKAGEQSTRVSRVIGEVIKVDLSAAVVSPTFVDVKAGEGVILPSSAIYLSSTDDDSEVSQRLPGKGSSSAPSSVRRTPEKVKLGLKAVTPEPGELKAHNSRNLLPETSLSLRHHSVSEQLHKLCHTERSSSGNCWNADHTPKEPPDHPLKFNSPSLRDNHLAPEFTRSGSSVRCLSEYFVL